MQCGTSADALNATLAAIHDRFPPELLARPNWVCWQLVPDQKRPGKLKKLPKDPHTGGNAKSNDPATWGAFGDACACTVRRGFTGVGFMFDGEYFGVDLDHCIDEATGEVSPLAEEVFAALASYAELSPSGTGLHIICRGALPTAGGKGKRNEAIEVYGSGRFFTVTGRPFAGQALPLADGSSVIQAIIDRHILGVAVPAAPPPVEAQPLAGADILRLASNARNGALFASLMRGEWQGRYSSQSEADQALCNLLAFWTDKAPALMDELFRQSGLMRPKWDERHGQNTYGEMTVAKAIKDTRKTFTPTGQGATSAPSPQEAGKRPAREENNPLFDRYAMRYAQAGGSYLSEHGQTYTYGSTKENGTFEIVPLADFVCAPVEEIIRDDGSRAARELVIEGVNCRGEELPQVVVPASQFAGMGWVTEKWGCRACVAAGTSKKDKLREAIQRVGGLTAVHRTVYTHTGWRKIGGRWCYLYHGGAVGVDGLTVELQDAMANYRMAEPAQDPRAAALASKAFLGVAPLRVTAPLLAHMYLAPLCEFLRAAEMPAAHVLFLAGRTGTRKSTLAALALSHFGRFSAKMPPASFSDTANTTRYKAFALKDMPLLVDDLHPTDDPIQRRNMAGVAQSLARAWGDLAERGRMLSNLTLQTAQSPRGLGLMTGEDLPAIYESGVARYFLVEMKPGDVPAGDRLTAMQEQAHAGLLAQAMRGYIEWLLPQADDLPARLREAFVKQRAAVSKAFSGHGRLVEAVAHLRLAYAAMLAYWEAAGAIDATERAQIYREGAEAILANVVAQQAAMRNDDPVDMFLSSMREMKATGRMTLIAVADAIGTGSDALCGYFDAEHIYLMPRAVYGALQTYFREQGLTFPLTAPTLWKRLAERGLIAAGRDGMTSKTKRIGAESSRYVWLYRSALRLSDEE